MKAAGTTLSCRSLHEANRVTVCDTSQAQHKLLILNALLCLPNQNCSILTRLMNSRNGKIHYQENYLVEAMDGGLCLDP